MNLSENPEPDQTKVQGSGFTTPLEKSMDGKKKRRGRGGGSGGMDGKGSWETVISI